MTRSVAGGPESAADRRRRSLVLVAAADPQVGAVAASILRSAGFRVEVAGDGAAVVSACRAHPGEVAAVLADVKLPGVGGVEALSAIRALDPLVRRFLMSGNPDSYPPADLGRAGAERVFARPFDIPVLLGAITDAGAGRRWPEDELEPDPPGNHEVRADAEA